jgi:coenzyme F420 hydrogenase subunit beta
LGRKYDFQIDEVVKVNVKHDFCAYLRDGRTVHIPLGTVDSIARPACLVCPDFSAEFSDFSFGGLGSPDGYTTAVIRSEKGHQVYGKALAAGYIKERKYASGQKARSDRANIERVIVDFAKKKKARALRNRRRSKTEILDPSAKRT